MKQAFTPKQGQYLAFIYWYTRLNRVPPAETDFVRYFQVSAPTAHLMIKRLGAELKFSPSPAQFAGEGAGG